MGTIKIIYHNTNYRASNKYFARLPSYVCPVHPKIHHSSILFKLKCIFHGIFMSFVFLLIFQKCNSRKMAEPAFLSLLPLGTPPKYLNLMSSNEASFTEIRRDFADVRLISSNNDTYLCSKLFLASMSRLFYDLIQDVLPQLDDSAMLVVHTNLSSEELKIVTQFVMFGYLPSTYKDNHPNHMDCVPPDKKVLELLKCFGIDATSFNFHYITPNSEEERLVHPTESEDFFWLQKDFIRDVRCKEEVRNNTVLAVEDSINNSDFLNGSEFLVPDMSYFGQDVAFQRKRKLYSDAQVKVEVEDYEYGEEDMEGIAEDEDPNYEVSVPKRKRKFGRKAQKSVHGNRKEFMELGAKRKKKRVGHFYNQFVVEAEKHQLSHASFAAYLGYRACINDDPITASSFKKLHEGISEDEQGSSSSEQINDDLKSNENGKSEVRSPFIDLTYEQKATCVGMFYDTFLKEAQSQGISASSLAAYCGARSTYRTDRASAAIFRKLHDGEDVKDKWSFKLWSLVGKEQDSTTPLLLTNVTQSDNKEMQCTACGKSLKGKVALRAHMKKLHPNYDNKCLSCNGGSFSNWQEHIEHANQFHEGIIRRKCNTCELMFDSAEELNSHKSSQHSGKAGLVTCTECGKQLMPDTMKGHMITEHGTEPCSCPKCGKQFKHPLALDQHFKRAHEECQCDECGRVSYLISSFPMLRLQYAK